MITYNQNKQLHLYLTQANLTVHKATMVHSYTNGRCTSSKDMHHTEAQALINYLRNQVQLHTPQGNTASHNKVQNQRRKIIAIAHNMGWQIPNPQGGKPKADLKRINDWCIKYSFGKKKLNDYTVQELPKLVSIFEGIYKQYLKAI